MRRYLICCSLLFASMVSMTGLQSAHADERRHEHREEGRERHEEEMRRREEERRRWVLEHERYHEVIAPAPVVYAPPPPSPGISIILPIHIH